MPDDYAVVADRTTEADISIGKPPTYLVLVKNENGEWDMVRSGSQQNPLRYEWDPGPTMRDARADFERQRARIFRPGETAYDPHNPVFDPVAGQIQVY